VADPQWSPSAETCLREAKKHLSWAESFSSASHGLELISTRPEPNLPEQTISQRRALFKLSSGLVDKEFEREMDALVHWWKLYREATQGPRDEPR
jgi:hypothetical protein